MVNKYQDFADKASRERTQWHMCLSKAAFNELDYETAHEGYWHVYLCPYCALLHRSTPIESSVKKLVRKLKRKRGRQ